MRRARNPKPPLERIKRNYEEDAFRQMTIQIGSWAEQRLLVPIPAPMRAFTWNSAKNCWPMGSRPRRKPSFATLPAWIPSAPRPSRLWPKTTTLAATSRSRATQAEASLRLRESAEAYLVLARLDLQENKLEAAAQDINRALQLEPGNSAGQDLKRTLAAKLAEKAQPLPKP